MNNLTYNKFFAEHYDFFYTSKKNYKEEAAAVLYIFKNFKLSSKTPILDIGCGTGEHALVIAKEGYSIKGIDISSHMIERAEEKSISTPNIEFSCQGIEKEEKQYTFAYSLFHVINCLDDELSLEKFMAEVAKIILPNGIFVFDCWHAEAIFLTPPARINDRITILTETIERTVSPQLYAENMSCILRYDYAFKDKTETVIHNIKLFKKETIKTIVEKNGFRVLNISGPLPSQNTFTTNDRTTTYTLQRISS